MGWGLKCWNMGEREVKASSDIMALITGNTEENHSGPTTVVMHS